MKLNIFQLLGLCAFAPSAAAAPTASANNNEIYYLVNCATCDINTSGCQFYKSTMAYYPVQAKSENGEYPPLMVSASGVITWEGNIVQGQFSPTNVFTVMIDNDGKAKSTFQMAGTGKIASHNFNCYKDQVRVLYKDGSTTCYPQYYCQ